MEHALLQRLRAIGHLPHLMVLTACESGGQVREGALVGLAPALIKAGAGAVVAMHEKVGIDAAREFNYHFYRRLATHGVIDQAANEARSYLLDRGGWSWSVPTLFLEREAERIFAAPPDALEAEPAASGEILILIPEFTGHEPAFFEIDLRDRLHEKLEAASLQNVRVVWLKRTAFGPGDEERVRQLAARYGAALVIWGWYDRSRFRACFSVMAPLFTYQDPGAARAQIEVGERFSEADDFALYVNGALPKQVDTLVFFTVGQFYYWEGAYDRALTAFDKALQAAESTTVPEGLAHAYFYRGNLHAVHRQDRPAAIADYERALALTPDFANAAFNLGDAHRIRANVGRQQGDEAAARRDYEAAIDAYTQAVDAAPKYARAYERRGLAHFELGRYEKAAEDYRRALEHGPRAEAHYQLGLALRHLGRHDAALAQFEAAILRAPGTAHYYFGAGRLQAHLGDTDAAVASFQSYLHLAPDDDRAARVRAWLTSHNAAS
jgi:tetratricopeptide (TPR) repeat protein